jgi:hypothetical protein
MAPVIVWFRARVLYPTSERKEIDRWSSRGFWSADHGTLRS